MRYEKGTFVTLPNIHVLRGLKTHVQTVYIWIAVHANENGMCFPSRKRLAEESGISLPTLDAAIQVLCTKGLLKKVRRVNPENPQHYMSNIYQMMIIQGEEDDGGSQGDLLGSQGDLPGVAKEIGSELYPIRTKKGEIKISHHSEEIIEVQDSDKKPKVKRDTGAWNLKEKLYDMFEKNKGVRPTPNLADYKQIQLALKRLTPQQTESMVEYQLDYENPVTVRECLTARKIDKYLQDNY